MKNANDLRDNLSTLWDEVKNDQVDIQKAKALVATSNSMLKSAQLQMEQTKMTGENKKLSFLDIQEKPS